LKELLEGASYSLPKQHTNKSMNTKYAILARDGIIVRIVDEIPEKIEIPADYSGEVPEDYLTVELTEDQVAMVQAGLDLQPREFHFFEAGELLTKAQKKDRLREQSLAAAQAELAAMPKPAVSAESHIESQGYPAIRLVTLMDLESKLAQAGKTSPKLSAVRLWLNTILGAFAATPEPRNDWPAAPFGFQETVQDAAMAVTINP
jgi:hypothetical protein